MKDIDNVVFTDEILEKYKEVIVMNKEPIILITKPEKQLIEKDNLEIEINNYDNSHLYYKGFDLGTFKEIINLRQENQLLKEELENRK